ncbi:hypothetical protein [Azohydromonas lata]|uniref:Uncharacterized protein n=1 Tax=Azohydromonas lata TaxID=45677 RepID=A0ABU5IP13_9BURK|nr:hypothetical protein [Azohydromonas lata]MDZ5460614.1 hypothetical protein [Azohydromonas lata]
MRRHHSFDIFDTLVARRCIEARNIFLEVENEVRLHGFANLRVQAELAVAAGPHTLDDIYAVLVRQFGFDAEVAEYLKGREIEAEICNAIGIRESLDAVEHGDVLVTDMYLPRWVILKILDKAGLRKKVGLVISSAGKRTGEIWPKLGAVLALEQHAGDNPHSDVKSPLGCGVFAEHVVSSNLSAYENFLRQNGFELLARLMREVRLTALGTGQSTEIKQQRQLQINHNIPILVLASVYLSLLSKRLGVSNILFSSRDCHYLQRIFSALEEKAGWNLPSEYFYTSRLCRVAPSQAYLKYFADRATNRSLVVDLCGTGWSLGHLYTQAGVTPRTFFLHDLKGNNAKGAEIYESVKKSAGDFVASSLVSDPGLKNIGLELVNYVDSGMVTDVMNVEGYCSMVPVFEHPNYPANVLKTIHEFEETQEIFHGVLQRHDVPALVKEVQRHAGKLAGVVAELYRNLGQSVSCVDDLAQYHGRQDAKTLWKLRQQAAR